MNWNCIKPLSAKVKSIQSTGNRQKELKLYSSFAFKNLSNLIDFSTVPFLYTPYKHYALAQ